MSGPPAAPELKAMPKKVYVREGPARPIPAENPYPAFAEYSFEYWFNYFYAELKPDRRKEFYLQISPTPGALRMPANIPDGEKKTLLQGMMDLGFKKYPTVERLTSLEMFDSLKNMSRPDPSRVMFRGDSREPSMIQQNLGTKPQTQLPHLHASRNFDKPWHPWNDDNRRNSVYFRNGDVNQDNCLFSAISVTPEFYIATKFPMMHQVTLGQAVVDIERQAAHASNVKSMVSKFSTAKLERITLPCSRTNIYAVKVKKGWNTEAYQSDTFPERAYSNLRWIDHFARIKVIRIHYGTDSNKGHLTIVDGWEMLPNKNDFDSNIKASMKKLAVTNPGAVATLTQNLKAFLQKTDQECKLFQGKGGHSYVPEGVVTPFTIKNVHSITW